MPVQKTKKPLKKVVVKPAASKSGGASAGSAAPKASSARVAPSKDANGRNGATAKPKPAQSSAKLQLQAFEQAIRFMHKRNFREAKEWFEKARQGPSAEVAANAGTHVRMCDSRLAAPAPEPKSAEDHYNYAVALLNLRNLPTARRHLELALEMEPRADHVHYALAVCHALSGDTQPAYDSLKRAIDLQPRNRMVARQDSDLDKVGTQTEFINLLYPDD